MVRAVARRLSKHSQVLLDTEHCRLERFALPTVALRAPRGGGPEYWLSSSGAAGKLDATPISDMRRHSLFGARQLLRLVLPTSPGGVSTAGHQSKSEVAVGTRLLIDDLRVRIWEFRLEAGERCPFHTHQLPYCFTNLSSNLTQALDASGASVGEPAWQTRGRTIYVPPDSLGSHGVRNVGDSTFLQFIVEFKGKQLLGSHVG